MQSLILILHILVSIAIVALVLLQHGRGADVGASFGSGASNTMFGSAGAVPFLVKVTVVCAGIFFMTSLSLSYIAAHREHQTQSQLLNMPVLPKTAAPVIAPTTVKQSTQSNDGTAFVPNTEDNQKSGTDNR